MACAGGGLFETRRVQVHKHYMYVYSSVGNRTPETNEDRLFKVCIGYD